MFQHKRRGGAGHRRIIDEMTGVLSDAAAALMVRTLPSHNFDTGIGDPMEMDTSAVNGHEALLRTTWEWFENLPHPQTAAEGASNLPGTLDEIEAAVAARRAGLQVVLATVREVAPLMFPTDESIHAWVNQAAQSARAEEAKSERIVVEDDDRDALEGILRLARSCDDRSRWPGMVTAAVGPGW